MPLKQDHLSVTWTNTTDSPLECAWLMQPLSCLYETEPVQNSLHNRLSSEGGCLRKILHKRVSSHLSHFRLDETRGGTGGRFTVSITSGEPDSSLVWIALLTHFYTVLWMHSPVKIAKINLKQHIFIYHTNYLTNFEQLFKNIKISTGDDFEI